MKGINDDEHICSLCGRHELKRVMWLAAVDADGAESKPQPYGTSCAARLIAGTTNTQMVRLADALAYIARWTERGADIDAICSAVGVRYNVWATVDAGTLMVNTPTGWTAV